ncbi:MAG TPA: hypothetical protein VGM90_30800 [Kofleriaceae bacterium]|jgi:hypothetical protein
MRASLALLALAVLYPAVAHAGDNAVSIGSFSRALRSNSANAISSDDLAGVHLTIERDVGHDLGIDLFPKLQLWATATWEYGTVDGSMFQTITTEGTTHILTLGGRARYALRPWVAVSARLDAGVQHTGLQLDEGGMTAQDHAWGSVATSAVGAELIAVDHIGLRFEMGYLAASGVALAPVADKDSNMLQLSTAQASIGHLDLSGRFVTVSLLGAF